MLSSFFMPSLDMESLDIESLDIVSFFMLSLLILSWAKAAGAKARPSERAAAEIPSATRVRMVMICHPFEDWFYKRLLPPQPSTGALPPLLPLKPKNLPSTGFCHLCRGFLPRTRHNFARVERVISLTHIRCDWAGVHRSKSHQLCQDRLSD